MLFAQCEELRLSHDSKGHGQATLYFDKVTLKRCKENALIRVGYCCQPNTSRGKAILGWHQRERAIPTYSKHETSSTSLPKPDMGPCRGFFLEEIIVLQGVSVRVSPSARPNASLSARGGLLVSNALEDAKYIQQGLHFPAPFLC